MKYRLETRHILGQDDERIAIKLIFVKTTDGDNPSNKNILDVFDVLNEVDFSKGISTYDKERKIKPTSKEDQLIKTTPRKEQIKGSINISDFKDQLENQPIYKVERVEEKDGETEFWKAVYIAVFQGGHSEHMAKIEADVAVKNLRTFKKEGVE